MVADFEYQLRTVGLGEVHTSHDPTEVLVAYGLGSCVAIGICDPVTKMGGLLHAVLPTAPSHHEMLPAKYMDSGIALLLRDFPIAESSYTRLLVWMVGGANMLATAPGLAHSFNIGERNIDTARTLLSKLGLTIRAAAVGGHVGRTVRLYVGESRLSLHQMGGPEQYL